MACATSRSVGPWTSGPRDFGPVRKGQSSQRFVEKTSARFKPAARPASKSAELSPIHPRRPRGIALRPRRIGEHPRLGFATVAALDERRVGPGAAAGGACTSRMREHGLRGRSARRPGRRWSSHGVGRNLALGRTGLIGGNGELEPRLLEGSMPSTAPWNRRSWSGETRRSWRRLLRPGRRR